MCGQLFRLALLALLIQGAQANRAICQATSSTSGSDGERVAVLPFEVRGMPPTERIRLREMFVRALEESKRFTVEPENVFKNYLDLAGVTTIDSCNTRPCLAHLGTIVYVSKVIYVSVDRWENRYIMQIRMVESSDAALLYDERVDFAGEFDKFLADIVPEQGRKLSAAFLDTKPNWYLIGAAILVGVGVIYWIYSTFASMSSSETEPSNPIGAPK